jgi:3-carboxy-cis,cis-muconate cycloisomerase
MTDLLRTRPAATPAMLAVWSDAATIARALAFEAALARAQAAEGLIEPEAAGLIVSACEALAVDPAELAEEAALAGTLAIPLVRRLRTAAGTAADAVHLGATSQDMADTVMMLQAHAAAPLLIDDAARVRQALHRIAERHAATPAVGRTLLQDAVPIGWGLRVAAWVAGIEDAAHRLTAETAMGSIAQLGGAVGTRAGMSGRGTAVAARVAEALKLGTGPPWHARRGSVAAIAAALGILIGALAKMARDVSLLAQPAVGEAREPLVAGRGGSSTMAHKRNPTGCQVALAAATRAPGLVAGVLAAMPAEWERGLGGWQAEGPMLADLFLLASGAADAMAAVAEGLEVDEAAIARNLGDMAEGARDIGESAALVRNLLNRRD